MQKEPVETQQHDTPRIPPAGNPRRWLRWIPAAVFGTFIIGVFHVSGKLIPFNWLVNVLWLLPWLFLLERTYRNFRANMLQGNPRTWAPLIVMTATLVVMLFSSAVLHKWFFFLRWAPADGDVAGLPHRLAWFVLIAGFLTPLFLTRNLRFPWIILAILLVSQFACFHALMKFTGGHALARDDHPSMMFRLWEISKTWPQMLNYIPFWNAGVVHYTGMASGLNALGVMMSPFLAFHKVHEIYTTMIGTAFIVVVPLMAALSVRVAGGRGVALWAAGILALGVSQHFFLWLLQYGTVGACFSTSFILPFAASVFRVLWMGRQERWVLVLMIVSFVFLLMWPPGAIMASTVLFAAIVNFRRWNWRRIITLTACGLVGTGLLYKTAGLLYFEGGQQFFHHMLSSATFATTPTTTSLELPAWNSALEKGWKNMIALLHEVNPVITVLGFAGALVFPLRSVRWWFTPILLALAVLCGWGPVVLPHLELGRMSIALAFAAIAPAALAIERLLRTSHFRLAIVRSSLVALLILTGWNVAAIYSGKQKHFSTSYLGEKTSLLADAISTNAPPGSRVLFAGSCVHAYGDGGHVAMFPYLTGREMMACDYYHFSPKLVEYEYPPRPFRDNHDSIFAFMRTYNVSLIVARHRPPQDPGLDWVRRLDSEQERYRKVAEFGKPSISVYRVTGDDFSMFLRGNGTIDATFNRIRVSTAKPDQRTIIKYNWVDGLKTKPPVQIKPFKADNGFDLIEVVWNGQTECTITFDSVW